MSWTNNSKNAQFYPSTRVGNNVTVGNCSYPNGTVFKVKFAQKVNCIRLRSLLNESARQNNYFSSVTKI